MLQTATETETEAMSIQNKSNISNCSSGGSRGSVHIINDGGSKCGAFETVCPPPRSPLLLLLSKMLTLLLLLLLLQCLWHDKRIGIDSEAAALSNCCSAAFTWLSRCC